MTQSLTQLSGMLCNKPAFQSLIGVTNKDSAAAHVRTYCGIASRRELDSNPEAARRFHELRRAFAYGGQE